MIVNFQDGTSVTADVFINDVFGEMEVYRNGEVIATTDWTGRWLIIQGCIANKLSVYDITKKRFIPEIENA